jgi:exopolysaccharide biosynthesis polyprenyl glycosylphosphotransferase
MIKERSQRAKYLLSDFCALNIGWLLFTVIRYSVLPEYFTVHYSFKQHILSTPVLSGQILFPLMMIALYWLSGYYNNAFFKSRLDEVVNTAYVTLIGSIIIFFAVLINDGIPERLQNYELMSAMWALLFIPVYLGRFSLTYSVTKKVRAGEIAFNTIIIGATANAIKMATKVEKQRRGNGFNIVGFVETNPHREMKPYKNIPVYTLSELENAIKSLEVTRLIVVPNNSGTIKTGELINHLLCFNCSIFVTPDLYNLIVARPRIANIIGEPLIDISSSATSARTLNCKRLADIVLSFIALILLIPVYIAIAIAVKLDSSGPIIYSQERIGYHKRPFKIYKFRTMTVDSEPNGPSLSSDNDNRITNIGKFLRKYRLDELPQFYNVIRGDMSLVGPRPEREYYIKQIVAKAPYYNLIHQVRPGITSWGMVKYGYATTVDQMIERLQYDLIYLDNVSLLIDLKILFHTVNTVFTGKGL